MFNLSKILRKRPQYKPLQESTIITVRPFNEDREMTSREDRRRQEKIWKRIYEQLNNCKPMKV